MARPRLPAGLRAAAQPLSLSTRPRLGLFVYLLPDAVQAHRPAQPRTRVAGTRRRQAAQDPAQAFRRTGLRIVRDRHELVVFRQAHSPHDRGRRHGAPSAAQETGRGVLLLSAHFNSIEIGCRALAARLPLNVMYRPTKNLLIGEFVHSRRAVQTRRAIPRDDVRTLIKALKDGDVVWYAPDQSFRKKGAEMVKLFGIPAATNVATSRIAGMTRALVLPYFFERLPGGGYQGDHPSAARELPHGRRRGRYRAVQPAGRGRGPADSGPVPVDSPAFQRFIGRLPEVLRIASGPL